MKLASIILTFLSATTHCANILAILPGPYYSHLRFHEKVLQTLLDRGHTVTALVEGALKEHENLTQHNLNCSQELLEFDIFKMVEAFEGGLAMSLFIPTMKQQLAHLEVEIVAKMIKEGKKNHFDLVISESFTYTFLNQFAELYDCPIVISTPLDTSYQFHYAMGNEVNPNMLADSFFFAYEAESVKFVERLKATLCITFYMIAKPILDMWIYSKIKSHFLHARESQGEIESRIALIMTNTHQALGFVRPETNRIHVGFLDIEKPKALADGALKEFVEKSEKGIILVNFGSIIRTSSFPAKTLSAFLKVFENLQYGVVWKLEDIRLTNDSKNIFLSNWLPQIDLLGHSKMKLLVTHGGLNSVQESIDQSVPMLVIPVVGDQVYNAQVINQKELGVVLRHRDITEKTLTEAINKALESKYKNNVEKLREIVYSYPMSSRETIVWWIEHVIKHKGLDHIRYPGRKVSFFRKYFLDLIFYTLAALFILTKLLRIITTTYRTRKLTKPADKNLLNKNKTD